MAKLSPDEQRQALLDLQGACVNGNKIGMIKSVRMLKPSLGLAEAKELVERHMSITTGEALYIRIKSDINDALTIKFTKEQFLQLLSEAIDNAETYFMDPLDAVLTMCTNLKNRGGLEYIAAKNETFVDKI